MHVAITGSRGLIGSTLVPVLTGGGYQITRLVRGSPGPGEVQWQPSATSWDGAALEGVDSVVHLAGENIASARWSDEVQERIRASRVDGTRILCEGLARLTTPPKVLVAASAIGYYGNRGAEILDEQSAGGEGFLSEVAQAWEAAAEPAMAAGIRVVLLRIGVVLSRRGGAFAKMLRPFQLGCGGRIGNGRQYFSWIVDEDVAGVIEHCLANEPLHGPVNTVAPYPVTNGEFAKTLGRVLRRPAFVPTPAFAVRWVLGEMGEELLLSSTRVVPHRLLESGYEFRWPTVECALQHLVGAPKRDPDSP